MSNERSHQRAPKGCGWADICFHPTTTPPHSQDTVRRRRHIVIKIASGIILTPNGIRHHHRRQGRQQRRAGIFHHEDLELLAGWLAIKHESHFCTGNGIPGFSATTTQGPSSSLLPARKSGARSLSARMLFSNGCSRASSI